MHLCDLHGLVGRDEDAAAAGGEAVTWLLFRVSCFDSCPAVWMVVLVFKTETKKRYEMEME